MTTDARGALLKRLAFAVVCAAAVFGLVAAVGAFAGTQNDPRLGPPTPATVQPTTTVAHFSVIMTRPN